MRNALPFLLALTLAASAMAAPQTLVLEPASTKVSFFLEATGHDVEGLFGLGTAAVGFDQETGEASGEIVLLAQTGTSYKKKRDKTMHEKVLESATYPNITFVPERFEGRLSEGAESEVKLHGTVTLLGVEHAMSLSATVKLDGGALHLKSVFTVPYIEWGLEDPSLLFLRVAKTVELTIEADGRISEAGERASR